MPRLTPAQTNPIDYHIVYDPRPDGPLIGFYAGQPIAEAIRDFFGRRFIYEGIAPRRRDGKYDVSQLQPGEWIAEPGLVYHIESDRPAKAA